jgi:hypothetical protein
MSKYIKLNDISYGGISTVELPTPSGGMATFKDIDEIITPSGTVTITSNGTHNVSNYENALVEVAQAGGGSMEIGTFVGDGTRYVTIPVTSAKTHLLIVIDEDWVTNYVDYPDHGIIHYVADKDAKIINGLRRYVANANLGYVASQVTPKSNDYGTAFDQTITFSDTEISIIKQYAITTENWIDGKTYKWYAW